MMISIENACSMTGTITPHHAKYYAYELTRQAPSGVERVGRALFDAAVDLNPHQIEAALFALQSPISKGVILADEVGLGKTIEAGIVLCQYWAERRRRLLVICPASICKQWALEMQEKFNLPALVLDSKTCREMRQEGLEPIAAPSILIMSFNFANSIREELKAYAWDLVVIDEAHKLRNAYRPSNKIGQGIRWATEDCRKILLTATPLQNSLLELYGLSTLIDEHLFGDVNAFRAQYGNAENNLIALRNRLSSFCKRTLRNQVTEYIRYTERRTITRPFRPTDDEHALYEGVSDFLRREDSYALPGHQRHLTALILRKLLASSSSAIAATLDTLRMRLETIRDENIQDDEKLVEQLIEGEELEDDLLDEILDKSDAEEPVTYKSTEIDLQKIQEEIETLTRLSRWARSIGIDTKSRSLLTALEIGFEQMANVGAARKAVIFTESRRTQEYLKTFLENSGYYGQIVLFNGTNTGPDVTSVYEQWLERNKYSGRVSGSRNIDIRTALIEKFRDDASIMITTEAGAEGINLQFCSLVINYDLPWNPQRIEQRIGRCHRYGQKHDVVVINFLNERNEADRRVLELLTEKFSLFSGVFGASDDVLGTIESGVDFEKRILAIYQQCRTPEEIDAAFEALQKELDEQIRSRLDEARHTLFEYFDEDVHERLKIRLADTQAHLDRVSRQFWLLTKHMLGSRARFDDTALTFDLLQGVRNDSSSEYLASPGRYHLISKSQATTNELVAEPDYFLYRLSHPLGEYVIDNAKKLETPVEALVFDSTHHPTKISVVEKLRGRQGYLTLSKLCIDSFDREEYLLFSGITDDGNSLDQETMEKLFLCEGLSNGPVVLPESVQERLAAESQRHIEATISRSVEQNTTYFNEAREKLERWADDMVLAAEKELSDTKEKLKGLRRQVRQVATLDEQLSIQEETKKLEQQLRRQRQNIFKVEDEITEKRDKLIDQLEKRLARHTTTETLFTIRWKVV